MIADLAQLVASVAAAIVAYGSLRQARWARYHAGRADHALNGRPGGTTVSDDVTSIEARGVRDDARRGADPPPEPGGPSTTQET